MAKNDTSTIREDKMRFPNAKIPADGVIVVFHLAIQSSKSALFQALGELYLVLLEMRVSTLLSSSVWDITQSWPDASGNTKSKSTVKVVDLKCSHDEVFHQAGRDCQPT